LSIRINKGALEGACKEIIETILFCLPNAFKGTVYRVGGPPNILVERVTSGIIDEEKQVISWGLPERSDYNFPGKRWMDYRDQPDRPLEAMAWCVERQKSWTAEDPAKDVRSIRLQTDGIVEDFHHMEPVLVRKKDLFANNHNQLEYPRNFNGDMLWQDSEYVVEAIIKIHFRHDTIRIGGPETRLIKRLSRALGTELLSYQLREESLEAIRQLAQDKLDSCNILADSLRNAITKSGLIFSLIKVELGFLRAQWEEMLLQRTNRRNEKQEAIFLLNRLLEKTGEITGESVDELMEIQRKFLGFSLPPKQGEVWVQRQIETRWARLLEKLPSGDTIGNGVKKAQDQLKASLYLGKAAELLASHDLMPDTLKEEWVNLIYNDAEGIDFKNLDRIIQILGDLSLNLPFQEKSRKSLLHLKTLSEIMDQLENSTNVVLKQLLDGGYNGQTVYDSLQSRMNGQT
jgi:hypothetical protein